MTLPSVLFAVAAGRQAQYAPFYDHFYRTELPPGSARLTVRSAHISRNMNAIFDTAVNGPYDYVFYTDDDLLFDVDLVLWMIAHLEGRPLERVVPLVCHRQPPHALFIVDGLEPGQPWRYVDLPPDASGLVQVPGHMGAPGLIATSLLRRLPRPWFPENTYLPDEDRTEQGDTRFTRAVHAAGAITYVDTDVRMWHTGVYAVAWVHDDRGWHPQLTIPEAAG